MSVNKTYLPDRNSPEGKLLEQLYPIASPEQLEECAKEYGYKHIYNLENAIWRLWGIRRKKVISEVHTSTELPKPEEIHLPEIKLTNYMPKGKRRRGDEEIAVVHCGDGHAGKITNSYDEDVYQKRMDTIFESVMTIVTLHRNMYPITKLWIPNCGDNVQGENPYQGSVIGAVKMGVRDQIAKLAFPALVKLICSFRQEFEEVVFDGFPGNHGWDRLAPETSRADLSLYDLLKAKIGDRKGITINIHENFGDVVNMGGWRFFVTHLDGIPSHSGIPLFGIDRALKSWYMQFGGFDYALGGHFHQKHLGDEISAMLPDFLMCSTLVSNDDWALKKLKISSKPSQNLFGIHPTMGITWRYGLVVDRSVLMKRLPREYPEKGGNVRDI